MLQKRGLEGIWVIQMNILLRIVKEVWWILWLCQRLTRRWKLCAQILEMRSILISKFIIKIYFLGIIHFLNYLVCIYLARLCITSHLELEITVKTINIYYFMSTFHYIKDVLWTWEGILTHMWYISNVYIPRVKVLLCWFVKLLL